MTPEVLNMMAQFMQRVTLKPEEIDAWQTCMKCLQEEFQNQQAKESPGSIAPAGLEEAS